MFMFSQITTLVVGTVMCKNIWSIEVHVLTNNHVGSWYSNIWGIEVHVLTSLVVSEKMWNIGIKMWIMEIEDSRKYPRWERLKYIYLIFHNIPAQCITKTT